MGEDMSTDESPKQTGLPEDSSFGVVGLAARIAEQAHEGQRDKSGQPYIGHPARVAAHLTADDAPDEVVAAGWLHDVLEDTKITADDLRNSGIPQRTIDAVNALTHLPGEPLETYLARVRENPDALQVKFADLHDNTDPARTRMLDQATRDRLAAKYRRTRRLLQTPTQ
jgi:(p)ppGpp synthase/HD superfamily hydrolase